MLPSALYIMWPMHLQSLKLLLQTIKEEMHLQENSLFDLWPWGQGRTKYCTVSSKWCDLFSSDTKFEVATSNSLRRDTFTRKYIIWSLTFTLGSRSLEILPSTLFIMWPIQLQSFKLLGLMIHLQEYTLFDLLPWPWGQGHTKCCPVPSTSCDLFSYKVSSCDV